jgi:hypothetical protein
VPDFEGVLEQAVHDQDGLADLVQGLEVMEAAWKSGNTSVGRSGRVSGHASSRYWRMRTDSGNAWPPWASTGYS